MPISNMRSVLLLLSVDRLLREGPVVHTPLIKRFVLSNRPRDAQPLMCVHIYASRCLLLIVSIYIGHILGVGFHDSYESSLLPGFRGFSINPEFIWNFSLGFCYPQFHLSGVAEGLFLSGVTLSTTFLTAARSSFWLWLAMFSCFAATAVLSHYIFVLLWRVG